MSKFQIGDKVKVKNAGKTYSTYEDKFKEAGFKNFKVNSSWLDGTVGTIFWKGTHSDRLINLVALRHEDGRECLISEEGVALTEGHLLKRSDIKAAMSKMNICLEWMKKLSDQFSPFEDECYVSVDFIKSCHENANSKVKDMIAGLYPDVFKPKIEALSLVNVNPERDEFDDNYADFSDVGVIVKGLAGERDGIPKELRGRAIRVRTSIEVVVENLHDGATLVYFKNRK